MARKKLGTLSEQMYYVLLVLRKERCGAEIAEAVDTLTAHRVVLGPGTLYALLAQFEEERIIVETRREGRKRSYRISEAGIQLLLDEYRRLLQMIADTEKAATEDEMETGDRQRQSE